MNPKGQCRRNRDRILIEIWSTSARTPIRNGWISTRKRYDRRRWRVKIRSAPATIRPEIGRGLTELRVWPDYGRLPSMPSGWIVLCISVAYRTYIYIYRGLICCVTYFCAPVCDSPSRSSLMLDSFAVDRHPHYRHRLNPSGCLRRPIAIKSWSKSNLIQSSLDWISVAIQSKFGLSPTMLSGDRITVGNWPDHNHHRSRYYSCNRVGFRS